MDSVKIRKSERTRKLNSRKDGEMYVLTPPKMISKRSTMNTVNRMSKKFGYDYTASEDDRRMIDQQADFKNKAAKYLGGRAFTKKMTRFDKMRMKEELGFEPKMNPIVSEFKKVDKAMKKILLLEGFLALRAQ